MVFTICLDLICGDISKLLIIMDQNKCVIFNLDHEIDSLHFISNREDPIPWVKLPFIFYFWVGAMSCLSSMWLGLGLIFFGLVWHGLDLGYYFRARWTCLGLGNYYLRVVGQYFGFKLLFLG